MKITLLEDDVLLLELILGFNGLVGDNEMFLFTKYFISKQFQFVPLTFISSLFFFAVLCFCFAFLHLGVNQHLLPGDP